MLKDIKLDITKLEDIKPKNNSSILPALQSLNEYIFKILPIIKEEHSKRVKADLLNKYSDIMTNAKNEKDLFGFTINLLKEGASLGVDVTNEANSLLTLKKEALNIKKVEDITQMSEKAIENEYYEYEGELISGKELANRLQAKGYDKTAVFEFISKLKPEPKDYYIDREGDNYKMISSYKGRNPKTIFTYNEKTGFKIIDKEESTVELQNKMLDFYRNIVNNEYIRQEMQLRKEKSEAQKLKLEAQIEGRTLNPVGGGRITSVRTINLVVNGVQIATIDKGNNNKIYLSYSNIPITENVRRARVEKILLSKGLSTTEQDIKNNLNGDLEYNNLEELLDDIMDSNREYVTKKSFSPLGSGESIDNKRANAKAYMDQTNNVFPISREITLEVSKPGGRYSTPTVLEYYADPSEYVQGPMSMEEKDARAFNRLNKKVLERYQKILANNSSAITFEKESDLHYAFSALEQAMNELSIPINDKLNLLRNIYFHSYTPYGSYTRGSKTYSMNSADIPRVFRYVYDKLLRQYRDYGGGDTKKKVNIKSTEPNEETKGNTTNEQGIGIDSVNINQLEPKGL